MRRRGQNLRKSVLRMVLQTVRPWMTPTQVGRLISGMGSAEYHFSTSIRTRVNQAIDRTSLRLGRSWVTHQVGPQLAGNLTRWHLRDLPLDGVATRRFSGTFEVVGLDHLRAALEPNRGVLLLGNHFGANLVPAHWLVRQDYPLRLFIERPRSLSRLLADHCRSDGPLGQEGLFVSRKTSDTHDAARAMLKATKILRTGMIVMIANDIRWTGPHAVEANFLGETYRFAATWIQLARLSGAQVVATFCSHRPDGSYILEFLPGYSVQRHDDPTQVVQRSLDEIETRVLADPANSNDYFFWSEQSERGEKVG